MKTTQELLAEREAELRQLSLEEIIGPDAADTLAAMNGVEAVDQLPVSMYHFCRECEIEAELDLYREQLGE